METRNMAAVDLGAESGRVMLARFDGQRLVLEEVYRKRTTLGVNILPADIAEAVAFFASPTRSVKSTGNILNVDGGVPAAYPR